VRPVARFRREWTFIQTGARMLRNFCQNIFRQRIRNTPRFGYDRGQVIRRARGVYVKPDHAATRHTDVAVIAARTPKAVVCLVSALEYHGLTTQVPHAVWIMIHKSAHRPIFDTSAGRIVQASGPALTTGVEKHKIEGVAVQMTTPAKTIADCFRYRDTVGTDVAVEVLRDCLRKWKATPSAIFEMAKVDRVARVMRPYLEALA